MYRSNTIYTTILYTTIQVNGYLPIPTGRPGSTQPPEPAPRPPEQPRGAGPCPGPGGACPGSWWPWEPAAHPLGRYARGYRCHWPRRWPWWSLPRVLVALGACRASAGTVRPWVPVPLAPALAWWTLPLGEGCPWRWWSWDALALVLVAPFFFSYCLLAYLSATYAVFVCLRGCCNLVLQNFFVFDLRAGWVSAGEARSLGPIPVNVPNGYRKKSSYPQGRSLLIKT